MKKPVKRIRAEPQAEPFTDSLQAGWGPMKMHVKGEHVLVIIILLSALGSLGTLFVRMVDSPVLAIDKAIEGQIKWQTDEHDKINRTIDQHRIMNDTQHKALVDTQQRIADSLEQQVFYLSKTEKERAQYKIEMPDSLRRKLIDEKYDHH
jgi:hypothetical protein